MRIWPEWILVTVGVVVSLACILFIRVPEEDPLRPPTTPKNPLRCALCGAGPVVERMGYRAAPDFNSHWYSHCLHCHQEYVTPEQYQRTFEATQDSDSFTCPCCEPVRRG